MVAPEVARQKYESASPLGTRPKYLESVGRGLLAPEFIKTDPKHLAQGGDQRVDAISHPREPNEGECLVLLDLLERRSHKSLAREHVSKKRVEKRLLVRHLAFGERPKILAPVAPPRRVREVEREERPVILLGHSNELSTGGVLLTALKRL